MKKTILLLFCCMNLWGSLWTMPCQAQPQQASGAEVLGLDQNGNGIRDDLEPMLVTRYPEGAERKAAMQVLKSARNVLGAATQEEVVETSRLLNRSFDCLMQSFGPERGEGELAFLQGQILDTKPRNKVWGEQFNKLAGTSLPVGVPTPCDANP